MIPRARSKHHEVCSAVHNDRLIRSMGRHSTSQMTSARIFWPSWMSQNTMTHRLCHHYIRTDAHMRRIDES